MTEDLWDVARFILGDLPCSVELPAGTGKTQLLAAIVRQTSLVGGRALVLTHTNAGVMAIRARLRSFGVPSEFARVDTITNWAFKLVRSYSHIAGVAVPPEPDWTQSAAYVAGATAVADASAVRRMLIESFALLVVDEYQDCTLDQHFFVEAIARSLPDVVVFGDRLQAIFGFAGPLADWDQDVVPRFPPREVAVVPHRWTDHNPALGQWLLSIRPNLVAGRTFDFADHAIEGLTWTADASPTSVARVAHSFRDFDESVVLLDKWAQDVAGHASRLSGAYTVMEDIQGRFMREQLAVLPQAGSPAVARWLAGFAKSCTIGLGDLDRPILDRLERHESVSRFSRAGLEAVLAALDQLLANPTYEQMDIAATVIRSSPQVKLYRWEAWHDTLEAIRLTTENDESALQNLAGVRARLRSAGRRRHTRIASRTLLVKGLEYDHVVIADVRKLRDPRNLYVALSRARKSIVVIGTSSRILLADD